MKTINLLGSTGSIGVQTLDVARAHGYKIEALAAFSDVDGIEKQIRELL
jgi:1-deoxy-D-xylulose-5-phosphate reductoisomerase